MKHITTTFFEKKQYIVTRRTENTCQLLGGSSHVACGI